MSETEAQQIIRVAQERSRQRHDTTPRVDSQALNRMVKRQRAALTRAINSKDPEKVVLACRKAVSEWSTPGVCWPDDWSRWQRALDDVLAWPQHIELADLA